MSIISSKVRAAKSRYRHRRQAGRTGLAGMLKRNVLGNVTRCHVHDLRGTLITRLPDLGFEPFIGHKIGNHVLAGVVGHYNHNEYLPQR